MEISFGKKIILQEAEALKLLSKAINKSFLIAINIIFKTKGNIIISGVGKSGHIAKKVVSTMNSTGTRSVFVHPTEASHGDLGIFRKNDALIIFSKSGSSKELEDIVKYAKEKKIPIILISNNNDSDLSKLVSCNLVIPNIEEAGSNSIAPTCSTTMMISMGDAIALTVSKRKKFTSKQFGAFHPGGSIGSKFVKVKDIMHINKKVPIANEQDDMKSVLIEMSQKSFGCVGIIDNKKNIKGIITDGDLRRNMSRGLLDKKAFEVMSKKPKIINENAFVTEALVKLNKSKITSFFVVKTNSSLKPIGIVHLHDCLRIK